MRYKHYPVQNMSCSKLVQQLYKNTTCKTGVRYLAEEICKHRIEGAYQFLTAYSNRKKNPEMNWGGLVIKRNTKLNDLGIFQLYSYCKGYYHLKVTLNQNAPKRNPYV